MDLRIDYLQFGGTAFFPLDSDFFVPYLSLTIGATFMEPDYGGYDSETKFSGSLGGGFRIPFNDNVALNLGLRGYLTLVDSDTSLFCVSDAEDAGCLLRSSGSTFFQAEGPAGAQRPVLTDARPASRRCRARRLIAWGPSSRPPARAAIREQHAQSHAHLFLRRSPLRSRMTRTSVAGSSVMMLSTSRSIMRSITSGLFTVQT